MTSRTSKTAAPKPGAAVVVPAEAPAVESSTVAAPAVVVGVPRLAYDDLLAFVKLVASWPDSHKKCGCSGMHDQQNNNCATTWARRLVENA